jgi:hypothetical protein
MKEPTTMAVAHDDDDDDDDNDAVQQEPLSWDEARLILREILQSYLDDHHRSKGSATRDGTSTTVKNKSFSMLSIIFLYDLDLYVGALFLSLILLVVMSLSLHHGRQDNSDQSTSATEWWMRSGLTQSLLYTELIGTILLVIASFINIFVIQRRRFLNQNDKEHSKRREIHKFLRTTIKPSSTTNDSVIHHENTGNNNHKDVIMNSKNVEGNISVPCQLTSQTEVYPVFRKHHHPVSTVSSPSSRSAASWTTIPSLLLVKGDWIALQVGDIAPANCTTIQIGSSTTISATSTTFNTGDRITMESLRCTTDNVTANLPLGRTTIQKSSNHFLTLCNNMQICILNDSPIEASLQRSSGTCDLV